MLVRERDRERVLKRRNKCRQRQRWLHQRQQRCTRRNLRLGRLYNLQPMYLYKIVSESSLFKNFSGHVNSTQTIYDSTSQLPWIIIQLFVGFSMFFHKLGSMSLFGIVILFFVVLSCCLCSS